MGWTSHLSWYATCVLFNPWISTSVDRFYEILFHCCLLFPAYISTGQVMGWGHKAIEIRSAETGHLDGVFMHKKAQKLKFLCERNDKVSDGAAYHCLNWGLNVNLYQVPSCRVFTSSSDIFHKLRPPRIQYRYSSVFCWHRSSSRPFARAPHARSTSWLWTNPASSTGDVVAPMPVSWPGRAKPGVSAAWRELRLSPACRTHHRTPCATECVGRFWRTGTDVDVNLSCEEVLKSLVSRLFVALRGTDNSAADRSSELFFAKPKCHFNIVKLWIMAKRRELNQGEHWRFLYPEHCAFCLWRRCQKLKKIPEFERIFFKLLFLSNMTQFCCPFWRLTKLFLKNATTKHETEGFTGGVRNWEYKILLTLSFSWHQNHRKGIEQAHTTLFHCTRLYQIYTIVRICDL